MSADAAPVSLRDRVEWVDALRGFALLGIVIANLRSSMLQWALPDGGTSLGPWPALNAAFDAFESALIQGKFYSIFSFLFGLGFSIQMLRAAQRGGNFPGFFRRRLMALIVIGIVHALIWLGDILTLYALCGFALLPFRARSNRTVMSWALGLMLLPVVVYGVLALVAGGPPAAASKPPPEVQTLIGRMTSGTVVDYFQINAMALAFFRWPDLIVSFRPAKVLGMFLVGLWAGRQQMHVRLEDCRLLLRRVTVICLPLGLAGGAALAWANLHGIYYQRGPRGAVYALIYFFGTHVLALGYIGTFGLAWLARGRALLCHFSPVGRAALSNYLAQTMLVVLLMYSPGLGLSLRLPIWTCLPIGVACYVAQTFVSRWWLDKHRYGPAEWVWRMMTYRRRFVLAAAADRERAEGV